MEMNGVCREHSGMTARVDRLETNNHKQTRAVEKVHERMDSIFARINVILGGLVVACILLVCNLIVAL